MLSPLDIYRSQFVENKLYEPNAPHDPFCIRADTNIYYCEGYRSLTVEEQRHLDFPELYGVLKPKEIRNDFCGGYEIVREEPYTFKDKVIMQISKWIYDFER